MTKFIANGLYHHLQEAWTINAQRASFYAARTSGKSLLLSYMLIAMEYLTALPALWIDWQAKKFHKRGIRIIEKDLVSLEGISKPEAEPLYRQRASRKQLEEVQAINTEFQKIFHTLNKKDEFKKIAECAYQTLHRLEVLSQSYRCHFAMVTHLIESIGYGALHASDYSKLTRGESNSLSRFFLWLHVASLDISLWFDHQVQKIHKLGVGFLVNDIPYIPFREEYESKLIHAKVFWDHR